MTTGRTRAPRARSSSTTSSPRSGSSSGTDPSSETRVDWAAAGAGPRRTNSIPGGHVDDNVAIDAKRILLRYGAPINVLDDVGEVERIELARLIAKTHLPERERHLRQVLADRGYMEPPPV